MTAVTSCYELTVADVAGVLTADEHIQRVRGWADSAWQAWAAHHDQIRIWTLAIPTETLDNASEH